MAAPPTSQTDTTPFQGPAYFSAGTPTDEGNPFAFVSKTTQESFTTNVTSGEGPHRILQSGTGYAAASFFDEYSAEPPPVQSHPTQGSHHMPRGPPVPSQGSPNPLGSPTAQAPVFPPPTHGALESHYSQRMVPSQPPPPSQNSQMSQGPPPSQLSYPPQMDSSSSWEQNITAARPSLEIQGERHKWTIEYLYVYSYFIHVFMYL